MKISIGLILLGLLILTINNILYFNETAELVSYITIGVGACVPFLIKLYEIFIK